MAINVEEFYKKYGPMVLRRCRSLLRDEHRALDAMQETFIKLLRYKDKLDDSGPSSLLYRMATNICLNMIKSDSRKPETESDEILEYIASNENIEKKTWAKDLIEKIFHTEKASTREIAVMLYVDKMTLEQTAREVGLSVSGIRKRMRLLKERVQEIREAII